LFSKPTADPYHAQFCLHQIHLRPVLQRLRQVHLGDRLGPSQIRNSPAELQHSVISPRGQLQLAHGGFNQQLAGLIQRAVLPHQRRAHIEVHLSDRLRSRQISNHPDQFEHL
jgi:hypothetical protein